MLEKTSNKQEHCIPFKPVRDPPAVPSLESHSLWARIGQIHSISIMMNYVDMYKMDKKSIEYFCLCYGVALRTWCPGFKYFTQSELHSFSDVLEQADTE